MNYLNTYKEERKWKDCINLINTKEGSCPIFSKSSLKHELVKFALMHKLKGMGYSVWSEPSLRKPYSGRPDVFAIRGETCFIIEVLNSETEKECIEKKSSKYPVTPIMVKVKDFNFNDFKI